MSERSRRAIGPMREGGKRINGLKRNKKRERERKRERQREIEKAPDRTEKRAPDILDAASTFKPPTPIARSSCHL